MRPAVKALVQEAFADQIKPKNRFEGSRYFYWVKAEIKDGPFKRRIGMGFTQ